LGQSAHIADAVPSYPPITCSSPTGTAARAGRQGGACPPGRPGAGPRTGVGASKSVTSSPSTCTRPAVMCSAIRSADSPAAWAGRARSGSSGRLVGHAVMVQAGTDTC